MSPGNPYSGRTKETRGNPLTLTSKIMRLHRCLALVALACAALPAWADCQHVQPGEVVRLRGVIKPHPVKLNEYQNSEFLALHFDPPACIEGRTDEVSVIFISRARLGPGRFYEVQEGKESNFSGAFVPPESTSRINTPIVFRVDAQSVIPPPPPPPPTIEDAKRWVAGKIANDRACVRDQDAIIANEREVGRVSGVVNMQTLHQAGETKLYCQRELDKTLATCRQSRTCP